MHPVPDANFVLAVERRQFAVAGMKNRTDNVATGRGSGRPRITGCGGQGVVNGKLYVPYAGHFGDCGTYNGMVVGFNLAKPGVFGAWSTETTGGGSWGQSGVAFDGASMFVTTGNAFGSSTSWGGS